MGFRNRIGLLAFGLIATVAVMISMNAGSLFAQTCQCADWAKEKRPDIYSKIAGAGCAVNWPNKMRANGYPQQVGTIPMKGSLVVFSQGAHDADFSCGHVAYVENVNSDGTFAISEKGRPAGSCIVKYDRTKLDVRTGVEFLYGTNETPIPRLELTGDVTMSAYTVTGGQSVSFSVPVKNWGGNLTMADSYLDVTTSNGSIWKATGVNQNIAANGTTTLTFSGQLWQTPGGTWTVHEVSYKDSGGVWRQVGRGDNRILARSFTVIPPDTQPPTDVFILEPANGSTLGLGTHGVRISAKDTVGVTTVTLYLYTQPSMGASFQMNSLPVPLQSGTVQDGIWRTEIDPGQYGAGSYSIFKYQVIAKDAAGNSTTSGLQQYTLDRRDLPPSVVTINEPASGVTIIGEPHAVMIHAVDAQAVSYVTLYVYYPETTGGSDVMHVYNVPFHHGTAQDGYWRMEHYPFSNHAVPTTNMKFQARACDSANQCSFSGLSSGITLQR